jgi:hypothetical protein
MKLSRWVVAGLIVLFGGLQAWDSGVLAAKPLVQLLAGTGIAIPATAALLSASSLGTVAAVIASAVLEIAARVVSPVPLPELLLVSVIAALLLFVPAAVGTKTTA